MNGAVLRSERAPSGNIATAAATTAQSIQDPGAIAIASLRPRRTSSPTNAAVAAQNSTPKKSTGFTGNHSRIFTCIERAVDSITKR